MDFFIPALKMQDTKSSKSRVKFRENFTESGKYFRHANRVGHKLLCFGRVPKGKIQVAPVLVFGKQRWIDVGERSSREEFESKAGPEGKPPVVSVVV